MKGLKVGGGGGFTSPGDYVYFKSQVPLHQIPIGSKQWRYYDFGPKAVPPLICIPGTAGTADVYYKQIMALSMKGYRIISVDIPRAWNHHEWIQAFEKFLDAINVHHIHIYGTSLGGFLAQLFAQHRPRRVKSLVLSNTFLDTRSFSEAMPWSAIVSWTPSFLLKRYVLTGIRDGPHEPFIADSVDFVVSQVERISREDLASRLTLTADNASVGPLLLSDSFITIMDTNDYCAIPQQLKDEVGERYPGARRADLKTGGDFPFLSRPDEVNLHLQLHLRRVGVEPRPDLVPGIPKHSNGGNPGERDVLESDFDRTKHDEGPSEGPPRSEVRENTNDASSDDEGTSGDPLENPDGQETPLTRNNDERCRAPLKSNERDDDDDPPKDDEGGSRRPSGSDGRDEDAGYAPEDDDGSSGGSSRNGEREVADDSPKDSQGNSDRSFTESSSHFLHSTIAKTSNKIETMQRRIEWPQKCKKGKISGIENELVFNFVFRVLPIRLLDGYKSR